MATAESPMWVYKRTAELDALGFQMVPRALADTLAASGAASFTFDHLLFTDDTPPVIASGESRRVKVTEHPEPDEPEPEREPRSRSHLFRAKPKK